MFFFCVIVLIILWLLMCVGSGNWMRMLWIFGLWFSLLMCVSRLVLDSVVGYVFFSEKKLLFL